MKYADITNKIIAQMQSAGSNWINPVAGANVGMPQNAITGHRYSGINLLLLGLTGSSWATFKQWQGKGCKVKKGEKGTQIVFFKQLTIEDKDTGEEKNIPMLKAFYVFHSAQVEATDESSQAFLDSFKVKTASKAQSLADAEQWVLNTGATIRMSAKPQAYYSPVTDYIHMPEMSQFDDTETSTATEAYYSTLLHELTHWTGHKTRCDRQLGNKFGTERYAFEELVAELGAAFQCAHLGITTEPREDHAHYLNSWIQCLKEQPTAIFRAAALAEKAIKFIESQQQQLEQAA